MSRATLILIPVLFLLPAYAGAQSPDSAAVLATVSRVFEGMREADSAKVRSTFAEGARFALIDTRGGTPKIAYQSVDGWIGAIADSERRWDELLYDVVVHVDGDMASVWAPYNFYLDGSLRHCGVDSIELLRTAEGWKITQLADTRKREGCPKLPR